MNQHGGTWQTNWPRWLVWSLLVAIVWGGLANGSWADIALPPSAAPQPKSESSFVGQVLWNLITFNSQGLLEVLKNKQFTVAAIVVLNVIVFVETGLLIGFFLPGDSLLVTAGVVCGVCHWPLPVLLATLSLSAIIGDSLGYSIGYNSGPKIFNREKSFFFKKDHLLAAQRFYEKHGGKTIILARFVPIIRTFAPVVAGVGRMNYKRFLAYNICGGVGWVVSMIMIGYFLTSVIEPPFQRMFGPEFRVEKHIEKVIIIVVALSISPGFFFWLKKKLTKKDTAEASPLLVAQPGPGA